MQLDFTSNYFELFGLAIDFDIERTQLENARQSLQKNLHPDNFASASSTEKRFSMQAASLINEAYKVLSSPLARAGYLLKLKGIDLDVETDTRMSTDFLIEQMELRERMAEVRCHAEPYAELDALRTQMRCLEKDISRQFARSYEERQLPMAREYVRQWQFIDKLKRELGDIETDLGDA